VFANNFILAPAVPNGFTSFEASDYEISFATGTTGTVTRRSDGVQTAFDFAAGTSITFDGLTLSSVVDATAATPVAVAPAAATGDRLLLKPFSTTVGNISAQFSTPRNLAVASPWAGKMGSTNSGSLQVAGLVTRDQPVGTPTPITIKFVNAKQYIRSDDANYANYPASAPLPTVYDYVSGTPIEASLPNNYPTTPYTYAAVANWSVTLQGTPKPNDTYTVFGIKDSTTDPATNRPYNNGIDLTLNSGNASAMMNLRDVAMFDGSSLTDGYASLIAEIGVRTQSANYTAEVSSSLAASLESDRASVSGVNLDEEASKLLQYQQAYQASAKVIQIAQSIFDTLIQTISR
jgi:flagellar hook-associated protein 1 FlgK